MPASVRLPVAPIVVVAACLFLLACLPRHGVNPYDEGFILLGAQRVLEGEVPYRDFWGMYPPGQFYALAGLFKLFGSSVLVERLWDLAARAGIVLMVLLWARRLDAGIYAHAAWIVALIALGGTQFYGFPVFQALLFCLASGYLALRAFGAARPARCLFAAGIGAGLATLFRHDLGFYLVVAETIAILAWLRWTGTAPSGLSGAARHLVPLAAGTLLIFAPAAVFLLIEVPLRDLWFNLFYMPSSVYPKVRALPFPPLPNPAQLLRGDLAPFYEGIQVYLPPLMSAAGLAYALTAAHDGAAALRRIGVLLLALIIVLVYIKGLVRISDIHVIQSFVPAVALAFVLLARLRTPALRLAAAAVLAALLAVAPAKAASEIMQAKAWTLWTMRKTMGLRLAIPRYCAAEPGIERIRCFTLRPDDHGVVPFIQSRTWRNEPIYVGPIRHDRVMINNVSLYYVAERRSATKWHEVHPGVHTTAAVQTEIIRELETGKVRLLVLSAEWDAVREPNASSVSSGVTLLDDHIRAHFTKTQEFGPTQVWERR